LGFALASKVFLNLEEWTEKLSEGSRKFLKIFKRLPDTTMREIMLRLSPNDLRKCIHKQIKAAYQSKTLQPHKLPFGVIAMDGKVTAINAKSGRFIQKHWRR